MATVVDRIKARLEALQKSAASVSIEAGLGRSAVADILSGNSASPRLSTLNALTGPLECSLAYLIGASDEPGQPPSDLLSGDDLKPKLVPVRTVYEADVFRRMRENDGVIQELNDPDRSLPLQLLHRDTRRLEWVAKLGRMGDDSMAGSHIMRGDIITFIEPPGGDAEIELQDDMFVAVIRTLRNQPLQEKSLRRVSFSKNKIMLHCDSLKIPHAPISIDTSDIPVGDFGWLGNTFNDLDGNSVYITDVAARIHRLLPL